MKRFFIGIFLLFTIHTLHAQARLGEVASVFINTSNFDSSLKVYELLDFLKTGQGETPAPWMQVSDSSLLITLIKDTQPFIGLTYYCNNIEHTVEELKKDSIVVTKTPDGGSDIKSYHIKTPDGFGIELTENVHAFAQPVGATLMTMKADDYKSVDKYPNKQCGAFGEFDYPVADLKKAVSFWKTLGFMAIVELKEPYPHTILTDGKMIIGLHQTKNFTYPAITYFGIETEKRVQTLKKKGLTNFSETSGKENLVFKNWEGQHFFLFTIGHK